MAGGGQPGGPGGIASFAGQRTPPVRLESVLWWLLPTEGDLERDLIKSRLDLVCEASCEGEPVDIGTMEVPDRWS